MSPESNRRVFRYAMTALLAVAAVHRVLYLLAQPDGDPAFSRPILDGATYVQWARDLAAGGTGADGAFYHAPLYPYLLALWVRITGASFHALYLAQHGLSLVTGLALGSMVRRHAGATAGLVSAGLFLFHHPVVFFASRPLGETLALFFLSASLWVYGRSDSAAPGGAGVLGGLSTLARPNLILLPAAWVLLNLARRRYRVALGLALGAGLIILPVTFRNWQASGHFVPVSSNAGITAWHGNGPGAQGIFTAPDGFSGDARFQRDEATTRARYLTGEEFDDVEADRWWGRQAVAVRLDQPLETLALVARRAVLLVDNYEHSLDYAPMLDDDRWRVTVRRGTRIGAGSFEISIVPFAVLFGLSVSAIVLRGFRGTGGWPLWSAILVAAFAPIAFYVSSRYRLPLSALLAVPAGIGVHALIDGAGASVRRRGAAIALGLVCCLGSFAVPSGDLVRTQMASGLVNRASSFKDGGRLDRASAEVLAAVELAPDSAFAHFVLGVIKEAQGEYVAAEAAYADALAIDPGLAEAAGNLAGRWILRGNAAEAVPVLRRALEDRPQHPGCWTNLVVALYAAGDPEAARGAADRARELGVGLDDELLQVIGEEEK